MQDKGFGDTLVEWALKVLVPAAVFGALAGFIAARIAGAGGDAGGRGARLEVTSKPEHARITLDGRLVGDAPIARLDVDPGKHAIVAELPGYAPFVTTVKLGPNASTNVEALLFTAEEEVVATRIAATVGLPSPAGAPPPAAAPASSAAKKKPVRHDDDDDDDSSSSSGNSYRPPPHPQRDCSGEESRCKDRCWSTTNSCEFDCPHCGSCTSDMTEEQCQSECDSCKQSCKQNKQFCESSCEQNYDSCERSNDY